MLLTKADQAIIVDLIIDNMNRHHTDSAFMMAMDSELIDKVKALEIEIAPFNLKVTLLEMGNNI